jgi:ferric-dicitrate binding protein FerR (iron transport regulator)
MTREPDLGVAPSACRDARRHLSAGLDGEASEIELAAAARHAAGCSGCERLMRQVAADTHRLRSSPRLTPSRTLVPAVRRRRRRRIASPLAVAGAAAVLALAALVGTEVSARVNAPQRPAAAPELRLASLNPELAQADIRRAYLERQFSLRAPDPTLDRSVARQLLG